MAWKTNNAADMLRAAGTLGATGLPLTASVFFRVYNPADGNEHRFFEIGDNTANNDSVRMLRNSGGTVRTTFKSGGVASSASSAININDGKWHHELSLWASTSAKYVWLDGGNFGSNGSFGNPFGSSLVETHFGGGSTDGATWFSNIGFEIALFGLWTGDQSAHLDRLANGAHPSTIAPEALLDWHDFADPNLGKGKACTVTSGSAQSGCFVPTDPQSFRYIMTDRRQRSLRLQ